MQVPGGAARKRSPPTEAAEPIDPTFYAMAVAQLAAEGKLPAEPDEKAPDGPSL